MQLKHSSYKVVPNGDIYDQFDLRIIKPKCFQRVIVVGWKNGLVNLKPGYMDCKTFPPHKEKPIQNKCFQFTQENNS